MSIPKNRQNFQKKRSECIDIQSAFAMLHDFHIAIILAGNQFLQVIIMLMSTFCLFIFDVVPPYFEVEKTILKQDDNQLFGGIWTFSCVLVEKKFQLC